MMKANDIIAKNGTTSKAEKIEPVHCQYAGRPIP